MAFHPKAWTPLRSDPVQNAATIPSAAPFLLRNAAVPAALLSNPEAFGSERDFDLLRGNLLIEGGRLVVNIPSK